MKRGHQEVAGDGGRRDRDRALCRKDAAKVKLEEDGVIQDAGDDELLAALGYKVRTSSMADVALKLEQLEMAMAGGESGSLLGVGVDDNNNSSSSNSSLLTHLASETVHYNPSDLNSWLENMLSELNVPPPPPAPATDANPDDLTAIIPFSKRLKTSEPTPPPTMPVVMVEESQETGIRLVHTLLACAEAVQQGNFPLAETLIEQITVLAMSQGGPMRKVAIYFAEALARRIHQIYPTPPPPLQSSSDSSSDLLESHFYEACPYLKFAHFTANQAILEAFAGKSRVHVIDFGMKQGMQWPALMQALALRPGGPPFFRLTGIGPPQPDNSDTLQEVGWNLAQLAETIHVDFEYRGFVASSLADLEPYMFDTVDADAIAINSVLEFHRLLAQTGSMEKVLSTVKSLRPTIITVVEQEANHNTPVFLDRFTEALHYYSSMFDSLEGDSSTTTMGLREDHSRAMAEVYLGRQICDVVACEGTYRKERHEDAEKWRERITSSGLEMVPLGSNAFKQASMLLELFAGGDGYRVEEKNGCLMLGWHTRPLITTSAWRLPGGNGGGGGSNHNQKDGN